MKVFQIRPRFHFESSLNEENISESIRNKLKITEAPVKGEVIPGFVVLRLHRDIQKYWSPELHLQIEDTLNGSRINGLYGPRPSVWTMFMAFKAVTIFLALTGLVFGLSQWQIGNQPSGLLLMFGGLLLFVSSYAAALAGQRMSREQIHILQEFLDDALENTHDTH